MLCSRDGGGGEGGDGRPEAKKRRLGFTLDVPVGLLEGGPGPWKVWLTDWQ